MMDESRTWLMKTLLSDHVFIIGHWDNVHDTKMTIQDFYFENLHYHPIFSTLEIAREQLKGTPFASKLLSINAKLLFSTLPEGMCVVLNPLSGMDQKFQVSEFRELMKTMEPLILPKPSDQLTKRPTNPPGWF
jgi:hypothetical protein